MTSAHPKSNFGGILLAFISKTFVFVEKLL